MFSDFDSDINEMEVKKRATNLKTLSRGLIKEIILIGLNNDSNPSGRKLLGKRIRKTNKGGHVKLVDECIRKPQGFATV